mmetsp:Transcript_5459/g.9420  ORF Transcript_5459/g.9420 Transcript_5459/m.9420 type:complete len:86 (+) Transcript_5459:1-258(+)
MEFSAMSRYIPCQRQRPPAAFLAAASSAAKALKASWAASNWAKAQLSQVRTGIWNPRRSCDSLFLEQPSQTTRPHEKQWCLDSIF